MFKKLFLLLTLCGTWHALGMEPVPMDIDQEKVATQRSRVPSLKESCVQTILAHKDCYTPRRIAQLPLDIRNQFLFKAVLDVVGPIATAEPTKLINTNQSIYAMAISQDSKIILACDDHKVRVFDIDGKPCGECTGHTAEVVGVCVSQDNKIISVSHDGSLRIWDINGNQHAVRHDCNATDVCMTQDNHIVLSCLDHTVRILDMNGDVLTECDGHTSEVWTVCVSQDNKIISGSQDGTVRIWSMEGKPPGQCEGHTGPVSTVCTTEDNKIISGSKDCTVRVWDATGKQVACCLGHTDMIVSVRAMQDNMFVSAGGDSTMHVWNTSGKEVSYCDCPDEMWSVVPVQNNKVIAGSVDGNVYLWDISSIKCLENSNYAQAEAIWEFLQMLSSLFVLKDNGQMKDFSCYWEHIQALMQQHQDKDVEGGESQSKRYKPDQ